MSENRKRCECAGLVSSDLQWKYSVVALLIGLLSGCYSSGVADPRADTNTSWLQSCTQHSECAAGYACVQGQMHAADRRAERTVRAGHGVNTGTSALGACGR